MKFGISNLFRISYLELRIWKAQNNDDPIVIGSFNFCALSFAFLTSVPVKYRDVLRELLSLVDDVGAVDV